jgi:hypothetical protein
MKPRVTGLHTRHPTRCRLLRCSHARDRPPLPGPIEPRPRPHSDELTQRIVDSYEAYEDEYLTGGRWIVTSLQRHPRTGVSQRTSNTVRSPSAVALAWGAVTPLAMDDA